MAALGTVTSFTVAPCHGEMRKAARGRQLAEALRFHNMLFLHMAVGQNQWYHFGVGAPPILEPHLVGIGMFTGGTIWLLTHGHMSLRGNAPGSKASSKLKEAEATMTVQPRKEPLGLRKGALDPHAKSGLAWPSPINSSYTFGREGQGSSSGPFLQVD